MIIKGDQGNPYYYHTKLQSVHYSYFSSISSSYIEDLCNPDLKLKHKYFKNM